MHVVVYFPDVPMEMIRDRPLLAVQGPVARAVVMVSESLRNHGNVREVNMQQILGMSHDSCVDDHRHLALVTEKYRELVVLRETSQE